MIGSSWPICINSKPIDNICIHLIFDHFGLMIESIFNIYAKKSFFIYTQYSSSLLKSLNIWMSSFIPHLLNFTIWFGKESFIFVLFDENAPLFEVIQTIFELKSISLFCLNSNERWFNLLVFICSLISCINFIEDLLESFDSSISSNHFWLKFSSFL